jgi:hypothetical protein
MDIPVERRFYFQWIEWNSRMAEFNKGRLALARNEKEIYHSPVLLSESVRWLEQSDGYCGLVLSLIDKPEQ